MKLLLGLTIAFPAGARLYHVPMNKLNTGVTQNRMLASADDIDQDNLYQARGLQYVDLKVGCPPQTQSTIISTASSAIGFPCSGCTNDCGEGSHLNGLYHQELSSCFTEVGCDNCTLKRSSSSCSGQCPVQMSYEEGSSWEGTEVQDTVSIGGEDADEDAFPLRFGCQFDITGLFEDQIPDGIFGMDKHPGSAIRQWSQLGYLDASAFSLCYNVREDVKKKSGVMVLGGSDTRLHDEPMVFAKDVGGMGSEFYKVRIVDVQLKRGSKLMSATTGSNDSNATASLGLDGTDTVVLDSGTTCTYLDRSWRKPLAVAWHQVTDGKYDLFSHLSITAEELEELPTLVFELEGETEDETITVEYPPIRYMEKHTGGGYGFCMFTDTSQPILGNTFMSGHDVLHDLDNHRIGFAKSQCETHVLKEEEPSDVDKSVLKTPVVLQVLPIHVRNQTNLNPESPWTGILYGMLASGVVTLVALVAFYCHGRCSTEPSKASFWTSPTIKHAYWLSWISLLVTFFAIVAGISLYASTGSSLFLVLGLENVVDFLSSAAVLWRFFAPSSNFTKELEAKLEAREQRASVAISLVLCLLGIATLMTAIADAARGQEDESEQATAALAISLVSFFLFGALTIVKFRYAKAFQSPSLYKDGICSAVGTVLSASLFVNTLLIVQAPGVWWVDPVIAILCGMGALLYGIWTLYTASHKDGLPIFSVQWWCLSHGPGEAAAEKEDVEPSDDATKPSPVGVHA